MPAPAIAMSAMAAAAIGHRFLKSNFFVADACSVSGSSNELPYEVSISSNVFAGGATGSSILDGRCATGSATRAAGVGTGVFGGAAGAGSGIHFAVGVGAGAELATG